MDKFVCFGREHLDYITGEYLDYYHHERPHQAKGNAPLVAAGEHSPAAEGEIVCRERLSGVLRHYSRIAA